MEVYEPNSLESRNAKEVTQVTDTCPPSFATRISLGHRRGRPTSPRSPPLAGLVHDGLSRSASVIQTSPLTLRPDQFRFPQCRGGLARPDFGWSRAGVIAEP